MFYSGLKCRPCASDGMTRRRNVVNGGWRAVILMMASCVDALFVGRARFRSACALPSRSVLSFKPCSTLRTTPAVVIGSNCAMSSRFLIVAWFNASAVFRSRGRCRSGRRMPYGRYP